MVRKNRTSVGEEIFNAISHGVGVLAGMVGLVVLLVRLQGNWNSLRFWGWLVFGVTLILMYLMSTLYHSLMFTRARRVFKWIDHTTIGLFIAGSYTPLALVTLRDNHGWLLLVGVWLLTIMGILWRIFGVYKDQVSLALYLISGWMAMLMIKPLVHHLPAVALYLMVIGGLSYTIGTIFYKWKSLAFSHGIWHMFVLVGSICHFFTMMYV